MVKRIVVGAHYGLRDWMAQRISAVIIAVYVLVLVAMIMTGRPMNYGVWKDLFTQPWMRVATLLFAVSLAWHMWVGVRDIVMDYVKPDGLRLSVQVLVILLIAGYVGWFVQILWR